MTVQIIREAARDEGFQLCGIAPAVAATGYSDLLRWIDAGYAAEMNYFADRIDAYEHPRGVLPGARTIVALAFPYPSGSHAGATSGQGRVARYAWPGVDYHDVIHPKLKRIVRVIDEAFPGTKSRGIVDTAPLLEREVAELAGLGWRAKNTLLIRPGVGSYFFLACVVTDADLPVDPPFEAFHCGTCTACLQACPTDAFPQPGVLDASKCISYLTIEHRGVIPVRHREAIGDWLFGCDVCQEVCPWNRRPTRRADEDQDAGGFPTPTLSLAELFDCDEDTFRARFRKTPFWRTRRRGILRNAAIVLGNQADAASLAPLTRGLHDVEAIVRGASAWALGRLSVDVRHLLAERRSVETDPMVIDEIDAATRQNATKNKPPSS